MKKLLTVVLLLLLTVSTQAQLAKDSWAFGFGFSYPRYQSSNLVPSMSNYGAYLEVKRSLSEHIALRGQAKFSHLEGKRPGRVGDNVTGTTTTTDLISGNFDLIYTFVPCEPVSPYFHIGIGAAFQSLDNQFNTTIDDTKIDGQISTGFGVDWNLDDEWKIKTELTYYSYNSSELDGHNALSDGGGLFGNGKDSYVTLDLGLLYFFDKGEPSKLCQLYDGVRIEYEPIDYERVENIVKKNIPREVVKEVVVEKPVEKKQNWVLVGLNFAFASSKLNDEAFPVLFHNLMVLLQNPDLKVEIGGHTDNVGSEKNNTKLSIERAETVKKYLVARGVSADRLTVKGYGESMPVADNKTAEGRALNRRIEFKVK